MYYELLAINDKGKIVNQVGTEYRPTKYEDSQTGCPDNDEQRVLFHNYCRYENWPL